MSKLIITLLFFSLITLGYGKYLGKLNGNKYDPDSVSNPYGKYGSKYSPDSINNPYGEYGSKYSNKSPNNPYATQSPKIFNFNGENILIGE